MNVLAIYVAHELLQAEREKAFERRYAMSLVSGPTLRDRIAAAGAALHRLVGSPAQVGSILPKLEDYPYRS